LAEFVQWLREALPLHLVDVSMCSRSGRKFAAMPPRIPTSTSWLS